MRQLRALAATHGLRTDRVGIMGFSAGGHLAGTVATQPLHPAGLIGDELEAQASHADFAVLIYPVVSLTEPFSHFGSRDALLGKPADPALAEALSIEKAVTAQTPPMFIAHGQTDNVVPVTNAIALYSALTAAQVPSKLHLYENTYHGIGLAANHPWGQSLLHWLSLRL